ncbi:transcriptional regulator [Bradyrhizobium sp. INPA01-394B]|uniref:Transcriptional regulator n=1 Tax=Bradyrhizobium campsiandrae TaxID=1729892 RepID=A0ABR7UIS9_9BRAD|nr:transcriptional regulator [Bradyrhizobium campsiandrae]MBC9883522.1 transcriptional regulator [Bradyrhizobium campsiandrae]MBC9983884.1 transcriptional regulator [Bradyrhizobium campsiandrae]
MSAKKTAELSPEGIARSDRKRLAAEDGARARADVEKQAIEVRKNMARLREIREAKEAADAALQAALPAQAAKKRSRKTAR